MKLKTGVLIQAQTDHVLLVSYELKTTQRLNTMNTVTLFYQYQFIPPLVIFLNKSIRQDMFLFHDICEGRVNLEAFDSLYDLPDTLSMNVGDTKNGLITANVPTFIDHRALP